MDAFRRVRLLGKNLKDAVRSCDDDSMLLRLPRRACSDWPSLLDDTVRWVVPR